jgi:hypothetical protein
MTIYITLTTFCNIKDKNNIDGKRKLYRYNNKRIPRNTFLKLLHYLNGNKYILTEHNIETSSNYITNEKYITHTYRWKLPIIPHPFLP